MDPFNPINPYGMSKLAVERILADYARAYGFRSIALRYFNACGADPDAEIGELRTVETHLIPRAMMWLQGHLASFQVFGTDYPTADGTAIRDYVHVCDLADAHLLALKAMEGAAQYGVYNLGTGVGQSVKQVLDQIRRTTGLSLPEVAGPRRAGDPPVLVADPARARDQLAFSPRMSDLETITATAWAWHRTAHPRRTMSS
jgi:UDP-glucose 4-epimerase